MLKKMTCKILTILISIFLSEAFATSDFLESFDISVGVNHVCALTSAGIKCFGNSGNITLKAPPVIKNALGVHSGNRFSCVMVKEGIRCWGEIPGFTQSDILIGQSVLKNPKLLSVGYEHACGVSNKNSIKCWGGNDYGESSPPSNLKNISEISLGMSNGCVIADGKVVCWGLPFAGSLEIPDNIINPRNLTSGWWHHCVESDSGLKCWGYPYKDSVLPDDPSIKEISSGGFFNCAIVAEGVKCWDDKGKTALVEDSLSATAISVGSTFGCAITTDKGVFCWKLSIKGDYKRLKSFVPSGGITRIENVSAGNASTCVYGDDQRLKCWGYNPDGALDVPDTIAGPLQSLSLGTHKLCTLNSSVLSCFGGVPKSDYDIPKNLGNVTMISSGGYHICAGTSDALNCWGDDIRDALNVPKNLKNITNIAAGFSHACAVADQTVTCWGGTGLIKNVNPLQKMISPKAICAGGTFSCAIDNGGRVSCWGTKIPLAGEVASSNSVLNVPAEITSAVEISCGLNQACAIYNGKVKCWGNGQIFPENLSPQAIIKNPHNLTAGWSHTCALGDSGLSCWGDMLNLDMPNYSLEK
jgi:alpha-tubulin suppressor-like RCC1 family protein